MIYTVLHALEVVYTIEGLNVPTPHFLQVYWPMTS